MTIHDTAPIGNGAGEIPVWDAFVRVAHWALVLLFATAYVSGDEESALHVWSGYALAMLVVLRVAWGLVGSRHARFSDFVFRPTTVLAYTRDVLARRPPRYLGHNPLGGYMVVLLLVALAGTAVSGMALRDPVDPVFGGASSNASPTSAAPSRADETNREDSPSDDGNGWIEEAHEVLANFTLVLALLHIGGVLLGSWLHHENLVRAMITGRKRAD